MPITPSSEKFSPGGDEPTLNIALPSALPADQLKLITDNVPKGMVYFAQICREHKASPISISTTSDGTLELNLAVPHEAFVTGRGVDPEALTNALGIKAVVVFTPALADDILRSQDAIFGKAPNAFFDPRELEREGFPVRPT